MKKSDLKGKIKFEALIGLVLLIVFVGIGAAMFAGVGSSDTTPQIAGTAPATPSNPPAEQKTTETVQAGTGSDFELYYGEEPSWDSGSNGAQTDVTDDTTTTDDNSNSDDAQTDDDTSPDDVVDPSDIIDVDNSDISDDTNATDDGSDGVLGKLQDVEFLDLVDTETGKSFTLDDIANSSLMHVNMDPDGNYTLGNFLFDWILAEQESASYFDDDTIEVVNPSTEDPTSEVDFGDEDLNFASDDSQTDNNQDNSDVQDDNTSTDSNQNNPDNLEPGDIVEPGQNSDNTDEPVPDDVPTGDDLNDWING